jgi:hypothetical protein
MFYLDYPLLILKVGRGQIWHFFGVMETIMEGLKVALAAKPRRGATIVETKIEYIITTPKG